MKVCLVVGYVGQSIVNLIVETHLFGGVDVFKGDTGFFAERHFPIAIERAAGIDADGEG